MTRDPARTPLPLPAPTPLTPPADFTARLAAMGAVITPDQVSRLGDFLARLLAMNEQVNLTRIVAPQEVWSRHALDALSLLPHLAHVPAGGQVLDVGSGGGVPALPLAIARPDLQFTLVEATTKKADFLRAAASALALTSVTVLAERAEKLAETNLARTFDVVTARAVAKMGALLPWTAPFARPGGHLLLIKGAQAEQELADAKHTLRRLGCTHERTVLTPTGRVVVLRVD